MSKFELYNVPLRDMKEETHTIDYHLDDVYFKKIDSPEVQKGDVQATVVVSKKAQAFELQFVLDGKIVVPCDRCLDDMELPIHQKEKLLVKLGKSFSEEDEIVIVPESEGMINVAWFLYEFIVLSIPIKHVHASGECNKTMASKFKKYAVRQSDDEEGGDDSNVEDDDFYEEKTTADPRWDGLQNILDNN